MTTSSPFSVRSLLQAIAEFPQLLCQGLGRAARLAFLLRPPDALPSAAPASSASLSSTGDTAAPEATVKETALVAQVATAAAPPGGARKEGSTPSPAAAGEAKRISAAAACREVCRRVADFESDHPGYPAFLDSLLLAACRGSGSGGGDGIMRENQEKADNFPASPASEGARSLGGGVIVAPAQEVEGSEGNRQQQSQSRVGASGAHTAAGTRASQERLNGGSGVATPVLPATHRWQQHQQHQQQRCLSSTSQRQLPRLQRLSRAPSASPAPSAPPADEDRVAVKSEKALGAAMMAAAKGPGGGGEAAAVLLQEGFRDPAR